MNQFNNIDWNFIWSLVKDIVIPHSGTLIWNVILLGFLGLISSVIYVIFLYKKGIFKRQPKYYNWVVKLYVPLLIFGFLYIFCQIGFIRGIYKILSQEKDTIVNGIYDYAIGEAFESEENKKEFIINIQQFAKETQENSANTAKILKLFSSQYNTGISVVDFGKHKLSNYLIDEYGNEIYTATTYGLLSLAASHANFNEAISYDEFNEVFNFLLTVDYTEIENSIRAKITDWVSGFLGKQYNSFVLSSVLILILLMVIPFIEFLIYKKIVFPKYIQK